MAIGIFALALLPAAAANGAAVARVTAATGTATTGDDPLAMRDGLEDGAAVETGEDGNCSLLVDEDTLMEMCGGTAVNIERKDGAADGSRVVRLDRGEIRMVVEPRLGEEKVEIHTPAAIATILGTILHVSVDALGVTTITSASSRVLVESADPNVPGDTTLNGGDQIVIEPGQAPPAVPEKLGKEQMAGLGGCLVEFHGVALGADRGSAEQESIDEVVAEDIELASLEDVAGADGGPFGPGGPDILTTLENTQDDLTDPNANPPTDPFDGPEPPGPPGGGGDGGGGEGPFDPISPGGDCGGLPGQGCIP